jgi:serine/threonine protein kinase
MKSSGIFSLASASRAGEIVDTYKRNKESDIDSYRELDIDYLQEDLQKYFDFPREIDEKAIVEMYGPEFINMMPSGYILSKKLGSGRYGTTFSICKGRFQCSALKIIELEDGREELNHEIRIQNKFHTKNLAPAVLGKPMFYNFNGKEFGVIHMEQIDNVLDNILSINLTPEGLDDIARGFLYLVSQLDLAGYTHRDMHPGNIAVNNRVDAYGKATVQLSLIDFGHSRTNDGAWPEVEVLQFLRTLSMKDKNSDSGVTVGNQKYLWDRILAFYQVNFDSRINTEREVDDVFNALFDESGRRH